jgi:hypothetical protein
MNVASRRGVLTIAGRERGLNCTADKHQTAAQTAARQSQIGVNLFLPELFSAGSTAIAMQNAPMLRVQ